MIDGTPASCIQIGLYHFFADKGPVDLVLSGPNFGRNTTALFALSSGTLGGAMEGALCGKKSIGISYAYESESEHHNPEWIAAASKLSVKLVEKLVVEWPDEVQLYSINVPLEQSLIGTKIFIADMLQNAWSRRSCFEEVEAREEHEVGPIETEQVVRNNEERTKRNETTKLQHRRFQWAPTFEDIMKSASESEEGSDGRVIHAGYVRYAETSLRAS
jgi:tubulin---tyrosine ligase